MELKWIETSQGLINLAHVALVQHVSLTEREKREHETAVRLFFTTADNQAESGSDQVYLTLYDKEGEWVYVFIRDGCHDVNFLAEGNGTTDY